MRILVAWAGDVSPNLGVRVLGRGSADLLRSIWPDAEIEFMDFGNRPEALPWGRARSLVRERLTGKAGMMEWLAEFDMIWDTRSGDSFADIYGLSRHAKMAFIHEFAVQAGTPVILAPQTIGPFRTVRGRALARRNLRRSRLVFARDPLSAAAAADAGRAVDATATDLVFGIDQPSVGERRDVLLNVSGLLWRDSGHVDHESYRRSIRHIINRLLADGREVTVLPHVLDSHDPDNDVPVSYALEREFDGRVSVRVPVDLEDAREVIAGSNLLVGARMHACLNALSTGVPAVAMAYSRKFHPLMDSLGWSHVVSLADSTDAGADVLRAVDTPGLDERARRTMSAGQSLLSTVRPFLEEAG